MKNMKLKLKALWLFTIILFIFMLATTANIFLAKVILTTPYVGIQVLLGVIMSITWITAIKYYIVPLERKLDKLLPYFFN